MHSMDDSLAELYQAGEITYDTALTNAHDPAGLRARLHPNGAAVSQ